jgi:glycosyltransferase involved in cell wall biosynthesis
MISKNDIFLIIPCFNEQPRLPKLLKNIQKHFPLKKVIVVDDGSEPPLKLPSIYPIRVIRHQINLGKGLAMKTGVEFAFAKGAKAVIFMDADLQHDPREIPKFITCLIQGSDMVIGIRQKRQDTPFSRYLGNKLASFYIKLTFGIYIQDILSGYRAMNKKAYKLLNWSSERYGVEAEMIARLGKYKSQIKWTEIPIDTIYIDKYKGVTLVDSVKILASSLWWKLF